MSAAAGTGPRRIMRWRVKDPYNTDKRIVRMSWHKDNLWNLLTFELPRIDRSTVFQQRWQAKKLLRAYHVPNINERQFLDRHFQTQLPIKLHKDPAERAKLPPIQTIMFGELERRVDVVVFRSLFANSIWNARGLVTKGSVKVNGEECRFPARRLEDGDMITVDPASICVLRKPEPSTSSSSPSEEKVSIPLTQVVSPMDGGSLTRGNASIPPPMIWKPRPYMAAFMYIPVYLEVDFATCSSVLLRSPLVQPNAMEIPSPYPPIWHQLAYEFYAQKKRAQKKILTKPQLVVNGQPVKLKPKFDAMMRLEQKKVDEEVRRRKLEDKKLIARKAKLEFRKQGHAL